MHQTTLTKASSEASPTEAEASAPWTAFRMQIAL